MEEDYLSKNRNESSTSQVITHQINQKAKQIFKQELLPIIEQQVNQSEAFAPLRQMYHALILALYVKKKYPNHPLLQFYNDQENTRPINLNIQNVRESIYKRSSHLSRPVESVEKHSNWFQSDGLTCRYYLDEM